MTKPIRNIVIVGGGTAGWITAGLLAARFPKRGEAGVNISLVESPDHASIGVGEGTWPTIRATLKQIGLTETAFIRECEASFKQGSTFRGWVDGTDGDAYLHPFTVPAGYGEEDLATYWLEAGGERPFADAVCFQSQLCHDGRAPKLITTPEYAGLANYAFHLNAGRFAVILREHCVAQLGVTHVLDEIIGVQSDETGDITSLDTKSGRPLAGDLFIDCSGFAALLIGQHFKVPFESKKDVLFIDKAWATQAPYAREDEPIASTTVSTAQSAGWIWDIGLSSRKGIGHVFASDYVTPDQALEELSVYLRARGHDPDALSFRQLNINPGHRATFWVNNCVAVGLSAGFLEPLEASAIVMIELSAKMIAENLPRDRDSMDRVARTFNETFRYRWERIIEFIKLHYVLSRRDATPFWRDNRRPESIPESLRDHLDFWRRHTPSPDDFQHRDEIFSAASYQYVLLGMGRRPQEATPWLLDERRARTSAATFAEVRQRAEGLVATLPSNRDLLQRIAQYGLQTL